MGQRRLRIERGGGPLPNPLLAGEGVQSALAATLEPLRRGVEAAVVGLGRPEAEVEAAVVGASRCLVGDHAVDRPRHHRMLAGPERDDPAFGPAVTAVSGISAQSLPLQHQGS